MSGRTSRIPREPTLREREMAESLARARAEGRSHAELAEQLGVALDTVKWWTWRIGARARNGRSRRRKAAPKPAPPQGGPERTSFVEVRVAHRRPQPFEVVLGGDKTIRIPAGFDAAELRRLIQVLAP